MRRLYRRLRGRDEASRRREQAQLAWFLEPRPECSRADVVRLEAQARSLVRREGTAIARHDETPTVSKASLDEVIEGGRNALIRLMRERNVPMPSNSESYREAPFTRQIVNFQLKRSGILDPKTISRIGKKMVSEDPDVRKGAALLLGSIALDSAVHDEDTRLLALATLFAHSKRSEESRGMLSSFGFDEERMKRIHEHLFMGRLNLNPRPSYIKSAAAGSMAAIYFLQVNGFDWLPFFNSHPTIAYCTMAAISIFHMVKGLNAATVGSSEKTFLENRVRRGLIVKALEELDQFRRLFQGDVQEALPAPREDTHEARLLEPVTIASCLENCDATRRRRRRQRRRRAHQTRNALPETRESPADPLAERLYHAHIEENGQ